MKHLAIIMDGNRRYATDQWISVAAGHTAWAKTAQAVVNLAHQAWIGYITLWGLSTENLQKRSTWEVANLIKILIWAPEHAKEIMSKWGKIELIGDIEKLPLPARKVLQKLVEETKNNTGIVIILALVYGWKNEIIRWIQKFINEWWDVDSLNEENFWSYLDTGKYPAPDMIVRTWWDTRHSWFLLYQSDYSEYYFTEKKWPEFDQTEFQKVLKTFSQSKRNFWK